MGGETVGGIKAIHSWLAPALAAKTLDAHLAALTAVGVEPVRICIDKLSGSARTERPGLASMLDWARVGRTSTGRDVAAITATWNQLAQPRSDQVMTLLQTPFSKDRRA